MLTPVRNASSRCVSRVRARCRKSKLLNPSLSGLASLANTGVPNFWSGVYPSVSKRSINHAARASIEISLRHEAPRAEIQGAPRVTAKRLDKERRLSLRERARHNRASAIEVQAVKTVLDQRDTGRPVLRWYQQTSFAKNYVRGAQHGDRILRAETCSNDTRHFGVGRRLENLPQLRNKLAATNERTPGLHPDLMASSVDTGVLAHLAKPTIVGQRRVPGAKLHDDRVIRLLETLLHPGAFATDWTTRRYRLTPQGAVLGAHSQTPHAAAWPDGHPSYPSVLWPAISSPQPRRRRFSSPRLRPRPTLR
jgi:hypothetical protein